MNDLRGMVESAGTDDTDAGADAGGDDSTVDGTHGASPGTFDETFDATLPTSDSSTPGFAPGDDGQAHPPLAGHEGTERRTALHDAHLAAGAEMADLDGWLSPSSYGAAEEEHHAVRRRAGMFDVSYLSVVDVEGEAAGAWLRTLLTIDAARLDVGQARYGCLCNDRGGVIDDPIVHRLGEHRWRLTGNAAARVQTLSWLERRRPPGLALSTPADLALLAVQGPESVVLAGEALRTTRAEAPDIALLARFGVLAEGTLTVARTGCSGEDGIEIALPASEAPALWAALLVAGVRPCGTRARDTLRLEAGLSRHGHELDEAHTPVECGIEHVVDLSDPDRAFTGRELLAGQRAIAISPGRVGLVLETAGALERGQKVQLAGRDVGIITSAAASPTRGESIALARVERAIKRHCDVLVNERPLAARTVTLPFVRVGGALEID